MWVEVLSKTVIIIILAYVAMMLLISYGWIILKNSTHTEIDSFPFISVVVAARNEEKSIVKLLNSLTLQQYPTDLFEVVVVNDHSSDDTVSVVKQFLKDHPSFGFKVISSVEKGKKEAVKLGVSQATGDIIATTDADCLVPPDWLKTLAITMKNSQIKLLMAPVVYEQSSGLLQRFYDLEFISLVASGAGAAGLGFPFMGNAANMVFTKEAFVNAQTHQQGKAYTSGDDVFLIHQTMKAFGRKSVRFLLIDKVLVVTPPPENLSQFINQRLRWASKAKGYTSPVAMAVSLVVLLTNTVLAVVFVSGFIFTWLWPIFVLLLTTKMLVEVPVVFGYAGFANKSHLKPWFFPFSLVYPFYILMVGFASLFVGFSWKGRSYTK